MPTLSPAYGTQASHQPVSCSPSTAGTVRLDPQRRRVVDVGDGAAVLAVEPVTEPVGELDEQLLIGSRSQQPPARRRRLPDAAGPTALRTSTNAIAWLSS